MKKIMTGLLLLLMLATGVRAEAAAAELEGDDTLPGTGHIMIEIGHRYSALYFAARQKRWDFAAYQLEEIEEALERLAHVKPKHAANISHFRGAVMGDLEKALTAHNQELFAAGFEKLRAECMACHARSEVGFIQLPIPRRHFSPVLE